MSRDLYLKHLGALQALDQQIGEHAAYIADIADALTDEPGAISVRTKSRANDTANILTQDLWPTYEGLSKLLGKRRRLELKVHSSWNALGRADRTGLASPLKRRAPGKLKPLL